MPETIDHLHNSFRNMIKIENFKNISELGKLSYFLKIYSKGEKMGVEEMPIY